MICYRCGYCCVNSLVAVVNPKYVICDIIDFDIADTFPEDFLITVDKDNRCPYLEWNEEEDKASCKIHDKKWFKDTPCYRHNSKEEKSFCRLGQYIMDNKNNLKPTHKERCFGYDINDKEKDMKKYIERYRKKHGIEENE